MVLFNEVVFDAIVSGTTPVYSPSEFDGLLGSAPEVLLQIVADGIVGSPTLKLDYEHSNDGKNWIVITGGSINLTAGQLFTDKLRENPILAFRRVKMWMAAGGTSANVRLSACGRDY